MSHYPTLITILLTYFLFCAHADIVYYKSCGDQNTRSSFTLSYLYAGSIVTASFDLRGASYSFNVELWRPHSYPPNSPDQTVTLTGNAQFTSAPLNFPGMWRLVVTPQFPSTPQFPFNININANNQTIGKYTDIARYNRVFILYHNSAGSNTVTLTLPSSLVGKATLSVYGPFQTLAVSGGPSQTITTQSMITTIKYKTSGSEYFYIQLDQTDQMTATTYNINLSYMSNQYQCPYSTDFSDVNGVYTGCSNNLPTYGFPCINFNSAQGICTSCAQPWIAKAGTCVQDTSCPDGQYFRYGSCYQALDNCLNFQPIGGFCLLCNNNYELKNYDNGTQACIIKKSKCKDNQYSISDACKDYVANCLNFQTSTGICQNCKVGYFLDQNRCIQNVINKIDCQLGFKQGNDTCIPIDQNCIFYFNNNTCMLCARGYILKNQVCTKLICGAKQYSGTGYCIDASPFCQTFDPINGNCLTCIFRYYLQNDGTCIQSLNSHNGVATSSSCPDGYYMRLGTCVQINPLCGTYNVNTGLCTTCVNNTYFLKPPGTCILISDYCGYRTYFNKGNCLPVSKLCDTYDSVSGYCLTCRDGTTLTNVGTCIYSQICKNRQYNGPDGGCVDVSKNCGQFNPTNGNCLTCAVKNYQLNAGGVCCYAFNYMLDSNCKVFYSDNCAKQHPTFKYCLQCSSGYTLVNGVFGRCSQVNIVSTP